MAEGARRPHDVPDDRSEAFGERLLGVLLDRAHDLPPHLIVPLIAEEIGRIGGRDVSVFLQDFEQLMLVPLTGGRLMAGEAEPITGSHPGRALVEAAPVEVPQADGTRMYLPLLGGSDQSGVLGVTMDSVAEDERRLLRRLAALLALTLGTMNRYTDQFTTTRRRTPMTVAAEIQWSLLPPLTMRVPQVEVAGVLEPAYEVAGDSFDYALNDDILHVAVIDAMGHGLDAAVMATAAIGAYRHARRSDVSLSEIYAFMDRVIAEQFGPEHFVTAQMMRLNVATGHLQWVNAGHPAPLLIRDRRVIERLESRTTLPVGFGGEEPRISERALRRGDRVLCFTDGLTEERAAEGAQFGLDQLIGIVERVGARERDVRATVRVLSQALMRARSGVTSDDATIFLFEWRGGTS
ncbi:PP2C family protein-serine/threonine phosphatase [Actinacidiphila glaucinigra]|uniref:PP2C family protein-serine/threonine phosphatase n=1 Tax=Actinacidiphila glaucinigra TaxID=235986 RepID=UPI003671CCFD